jgi:chromosome partitioning protein
MKIISIFNQAGGVGKTTLTMNLGYHLVAHGHHTLLVDMDPQGSLSIFMGLDIEKLERTIYDALINEEPIAITKDIHGIDLVPANIQLSGAEIQLVNMSFREVRLKESLDPLDGYDFILIDCPPSLGLLSYISLVAATHILVPMETQYKAFQGTDQLLATVTDIRKRGNRKLVFAGFVPCKYAGSNSQDNRYLEAMKTNFSQLATVLDPIPRATAFADAAEHHLPLALYDPKHKAIAVLETITTFLESL